MDECAAPPPLPSHFPAGVTTPITSPTSPNQPPLATPLPFSFAHTKQNPSASDSEFYPTSAAHVFYFIFRNYFLQFLTIASFVCGLISNNNNKFSKFDLKGA
jgi:hypothetical protein